MKDWYEIRVKALDYYKVLHILNILNNNKIKSEDIKILGSDTFYNVYYFATLTESINITNQVKNL